MACLENLKKPVRWGFVRKKEEMKMVRIIA